MKKLIVLFLVIFVTSCSFDYAFCIPEIDSIEETFEWVSLNVTSKADESEYWQTPDETMELLTGDCEDQAILLMYLIYKNTGIKSEMCIVHGKTKGKIDVFHAVMKCENVFYDCPARSQGDLDYLILRWDSYTVLYYLSYTSTMRLAGII